MYPVQNEIKDNLYKDRIPTLTSICDALLPKKYLQVHILGDRAYPLCDLKKKGDKGKKKKESLNCKDFEQKKLVYIVASNSCFDVGSTRFHDYNKAKEQYEKLKQSLRDLGAHGAFAFIARIIDIEEFNEA